MNLIYIESLNRIAHRMMSHNGYRPLNPNAPLCELHPSCCKLRVDEDGLLSKWIIFHEMMQTSRPFLSKICPIEEAWTEEVIKKIKNINLINLSGKNENEIIKEKEEEDVEKQVNKIRRRNDDKSIKMARKRYLDRKLKKDNKLNLMNN